MNIKVRATQELEVKVNFEDCLDVVFNHPMQQVSTSKLLDLLTNQFKIKQGLSRSWYYKDAIWYKTIEGYSGGHYDEPRREEVQRVATTEEVTFYNSLDVLREGLE